jgi:hypothetical protein
MTVALTRVVSRDYFPTIGARLREGRVCLVKRS